jgi:hypothetical protein
MIKLSADLIPFSFAESIMRFATGEYRTAE